MKPKLLILSDLFGFDNSPWIKNYKKSLESDFQLIFHDSSKLAGIDRAHLTEKEIHSLFIYDGINNAVNELLRLEKEEVYILAFSVGGTIAWKAILQGLKTNKFLAVSSTRLRHETIKPNCNIKLIYGENDPFKPENSWFENLDLEVEIVKNGNHEIYNDPNFINDLCNRIKHFK